MKGVTLLAGLLIGLVGCGGVSGVDQKTDAELGSWAAPNASALPAGTTKSETLLIGSKGAHEPVPALLEWETAKDAAGCLRFKKVSLKRTGGPSSVEVYDVKMSPPKDGSCGSRLAGKDEEFEIMQVSYCWRWNGASNSANCAYSSSVTLNGDHVGVEGMDKASPSASSSAR